MGARFERGKFDGNGVVGAFVGGCGCSTGVSNDAASTGMLLHSLSLGNTVIALIPTALKAENLETGG